jgi:glutathione S-transferase
MDAPLLWHIPLSHYSEKVRWALDYKGIAHRRRVLGPDLARAGQTARSVARRPCHHRFHAHHRRA